MSKRTHSQVTRSSYSSRGAAPKKPRTTTVVMYPKGRSTITKTPAAFQPTGSEIKAIDIAEVTYVFRDPGTASSIVLLNGIQTGSGFFNRIGARIEMMNLQMNGFLTPTVAGASTTPSNLRVLIVYDRQPVGALPVISDILQSRDQAGTATTGGLSHINLDFRDRFTIVRDMHWATPTVTAGVVSGISSGVGEPWTLNKFIPLNGFGTHFKSSSNPTTIADMSTGALYACFVTETNDQDWSIEIDFRLRYSDK